MPFPVPLPMPLPTALKSLALAAALLGGTAANAALTLYTDPAAFLAALTAPGVDSFDDLTLGAAQDDPLLRSAGAYSYTAASFGASGGLFAAGAGSDAWLSPIDSDAALTFGNFSPAVRGIGGYFFATTEDGQALAGQDVTVTASDGEEPLAFVLMNSTPQSFVGFVSSGPIGSLTVWATTPDVFVTANDLTLGTISAVPEPATWALWLTGLGLAIVLSRRPAPARRLRAALQPAPRRRPGR
jgi:hypothetical protein